MKVRHAVIAVVHVDHYPVEFRDPWQSPSPDRFVATVARHSFSRRTRRSAAGGRATRAPGPLHCEVPAPQATCFSPHCQDIRPADGGWNLVPNPAVEHPTVGLGRSAAPLFEEEGHALLGALVADQPDPIGRHHAASRPTFATDDHPVNSVERQAWNGSQERLDREESDASWHLSQVIDPANVPGTFDGHTLPDIGWPRQTRCHGSEALASFCQDLKDVPVCARHDLENSPDVLFWYRLVEEVTHTVDEDPPRPAPA